MLLNCFLKDQGILIVEYCRDFECKVEKFDYMKDWEFLALENHPL